MHFRQWKRREFITLLGAAVWPLTAPAQQPAMQVIGFLHSGSANTFRAQLDAFRQGLRDGGYVELTLCPAVFDRNVLAFVPFAT